MLTARAIGVLLCSWAALRAAAVRVDLISSGGASLAGALEASLLEEYAKGSAGLTPHPEWGSSHSVHSEKSTYTVGQGVQHPVTEAVKLMIAERRRNHPAAIGSQNPDLRVVHSQHVKTGKPLDIAIPREWADAFAPGSVRFIRRKRPRTEVYIARLATAPDEVVMFKYSPSRLRSTQREVRVADLLNSSRAESGEGFGHVETVFDVKSAAGITYFLGEPGDVSLKDYMKEWGARRASSDEWTGLALPLNRSLPILVDMLRGCQELEMQGLTHAGLSPENVLIIEDRAVLRGLASVCVSGRSNTALSCDTLRDPSGGRVPLFTSPFWQPPEAWSGLPYSRDDHTWAVGMLFAYMSLGYIPVEEFINSRNTKYDDLGATRAAIAWYFTIELSPHFQDLDEDVQHILRGLLVPLAQRWNTDSALREIDALAKDKGIHLPPPRAPPVSPALTSTDEPWSFVPTRRIRHHR